MLPPAAAAPVAAGLVSGGRAQARGGAYLNHMGTSVSTTHSRITQDYQICHGQLVVRGLRYPVWHVLELLSCMSEAEILADHEDLEAEDFPACQAYAASVLKKIGRVYETSGLSEEEIAAGLAPRPSMTKPQFLAHLIATGKVPPDTKLKTE